MSSFHGLELAKRALFTQQSALYTTGHNIANANTEGYSRQRVNFEADVGYPAAAKNRPGIAGQIGTGVKAGSIQRVRDEFLDLQFRGENSLAGYWEKRADAMGRMEGLMNELNDTGLQKTMDQFWSSLQDLAVNPTNDGARAVVVQRGIALADTFNYYNQSLNNIKTDLGVELSHRVDEANIILENIDSLNKQIVNLETNGYLPNDLYDKRDVLVDQLSGMLDITVTREALTSSSLPNADGPISISIGEAVLVDGENGGINELVLNVENPNDGHSYVQSLVVDGHNVAQANGSIKSLIETFGDGPNSGEFSEMIEQLNLLREVLTTQFNAVQSGTMTDEAGNTINFPDFFGEDSDGNMIVNQAIQDDSSLIRASDNNTTGDGQNALDLAEVFGNAYNFGTDDKPNNTSIMDFYKSVIGGMAVDVEEAERMYTNSNVLLTQVQGQRQSVSSVSLDEEMTNMIKFQHAYNAAARSMTATDELLDRIINNMGLVGR